MTPKTPGCFSRLGTSSQLPLWSGISLLKFYSWAIACIPRGLAPFWKTKVDILARKRKLSTEGLEAEMGRACRSPWASFSLPEPHTHFYYLQTHLSSFGSLEKEVL